MEQEGKRRLLALVLSGALLVSSTPLALAADPTTYKDMPDDWSRPALEEAVENGLLQGNGRYLDPAGVLSRAQMATILVRAFGATQSADLSAYSDVEEQAWYYEDFSRAVAMGLFQGSNGKLSPEAPITRQEAFVVLARAFGLKANSTGSYFVFSDATEVAAWAAEPVAAMVEAGYVQGTAGKLNPTDTITRAEFAQVMSNLVSEYDQAAGTVEGNVVLRSSGTLTGTVIQGDLIVAEGAGEVTLDGVRVQGRILVRGGTAVTLQNETSAATILLNGAGAGLTVGRGCTVETITVAKEVQNAAIQVDGTVEQITTAASGTAVTGKGSVTYVQVQAGAEGVTVSTEETRITVAQDAGYVKTPSGTVRPGFSGNSTQEEEEPEEPTPEVATDRIYNGLVTAPILMDASYAASQEDTYVQRTYTQIARAVGDLRQDIAMVTGAIDDQQIQQLFVDDDAARDARLAAAEASKVPALVTDPVKMQADYAIIVGAIDDSPLIQGLMADGKLDEAQSIQGKWEAYVIKEVEQPLPGVDKALVIAGSDARGTIYGIYTISEEIGVSPFYWYSDVPVEVQEEIDVDYTTALVDDGPDVKYRGIFINDEEHAMDWAAAKFPTENGTPDVNYYRHVYEMLLRLKADTLWPAMHEGTQSFNVALDEDGIPINAKEAAKYGIIMGNSHCEILLRTNTGEWSPWINAHKDAYGGNTAYDFTTNEQALLDYWRERLETNKDFESILTIGIRGVHDGGFQCANLDKYPGANDSEKKVAMMKDVITKQRELIAQVYGEENVQKVPQVLIPYKEMNDVYNAGLDEFMMWDGSEDFNGDGVIDWRDDNTDVMLMWAEDNHNYLRQTPSAEEAGRAGGAGIYYHSSYWGSPRSYLWTNEIQLSVMSEQMHRAFDTGADDYWILNVGDIKPGELPMELFMKIGWDPEHWDDTVIQSEFLKEQAMRDYHVSEETAEQIAAVMDDYYRLVGTKKPYFFNTGDKDELQFSVTANGDEGMRFLEQCNAVVDALEQVYEALPEDNKTSFYQLAYYNAMALRDAAEEHIYFEKNQLSAAQGRYGSAAVYAQLGQQAGQRIDDGVLEFNGQNQDKWTSMIKLTHPGGNYERIAESKYAYAAASDGVGASCENATEAGSGTLRFHSMSAEDTRFFDVFDRNDQEEHWVAEADADWVILSRISGTTSTEQRVLVNVDWSRVKEDSSAMIRVYNADETGAKTGESVAEFTVEAVVSDLSFGTEKGYVEANGYVAIEAEHYTQNLPGADGSYWKDVVSNGQHGDTMKSLPSGDHHTEDWDNTAQLHYSVYFEQAGSYTLTLNRLPTLNEGSVDGTARSMNVAVGVAGAAPTVLKGARSASGSAWQNNVLRQYEPLTCQIEVQAGWNDIVVYRSDSDFVFDRMVIETVEGAVPTSLMGPVESPNNIAAAPAVQVGALPEEALDSYRALPGATLTHGETVEVAVDGLTAAVSANPKVAQVVKVENGVLTLSGLRAGVTSLSVSTTEGDGILQVHVQPRPDAGSGVYQEQDGLVVVDAADAMADNLYAVRTDSNDQVHAWQLVDGGLKVLPDLSDDSGKWTTGSLAALEGKAPSLSYTVEIHDAGTYYLYLNMSNPDVDADSYHVVVDGVFRYTDNSVTLDGVERWRTAGKAIQLSQGEHTITIFAREDGFVINQLVLSQDANASFEGFQTPSQSVVPAPRIVLDALSDQSMHCGDSREVAVSVRTTNGAPVHLEVRSDNEAAVSVTDVTETGFTLQAGESAGTAEITVTATAQDCAEVAVHFQVTVRDISNAGPYLEKDGQVVINAADALEQSGFAWASAASDGHNWTALDAGVQVTPDNGGKWTDGKWESLNGKAPALNFRVRVETAGDYYLFVNMSNPDANGDSYHVAVDGAFAYTCDTSGRLDGALLWYHENRAIPLEAGEHTITIFAREDGFVLNQLVLTTNAEAAFEGLQTPSDRGEPDEPEQGNAYQMEDGVVVINAVDAMENSAYASHSDVDGSGAYPDVNFAWVTVDEAGESESSIQLTPVADPDNKMEWTSKGETRTPSVTYAVYVEQAGDYYLSFFSNSPNVNTDSFHFGVNGVYQFASKEVITDSWDGTGKDNYGSAVGERWFTCDKRTVHLDAGVNTITIWGRESGLLLRQLMLSQQIPAGLDTQWQTPSAVISA